MGYLSFLPEMVILAFACIILILDLFSSKKNYFFSLALIALVLALVTIFLPFSSNSNSLITQMFFRDSMAKFFRVTFIVAASLIILISNDWARKSNFRSEYYSFILFATLGIMLMASAGELVSMYISLELTSLSFYALVAFSKGDLKSSEAGLKYLILGVISSDVLLFGLALIYGLTGATRFSEIASILPRTFSEPAFLLSLIFLVAGFGFKIALVPFHMWVPDAYEGAPTPVAAFMSVGSKAAAFAITIRIFLGALAVAQNFWSILLPLLAVLSMTLGNLVALVQTNIKRMLAYSSIAQAGYVLMGIAALSAFGISGTLYYLLAYTFTNICAFAAVTVFASQTGSEEIKDFAGLSQRSPTLALALTISLLSLAGMPLFAGFVAKFYIFASVALQKLYWLVAVALINTAISLYYYLMVVKQIYIVPPVSKEPILISLPSRVALQLTVFGILLLGIYPGPFIKTIGAITKNLFIT